MTVGESLVTELRAAHEALHRCLDFLARAECDALGSENSEALLGIHRARKALLRAELGETLQAVARAVGVDP